MYGAMSAQAYGAPGLTTSESNAASAGIGLKAGVGIGTATVGGAAGFKVAIKDDPTFWVVAIAGLAVAFAWAAAN